MDDGYWAYVPGGEPSGCNPVSAAGLACDPLDVENPAALAPEPLATAPVALAALLGLRRRRARG